MGEFFEKNKRKGLWGLLLLLFSKKKETVILLLVAIGASFSLTLPLAQHIPIISGIVSSLGLKKTRSHSLQEEIAKIRADDERQKSFWRRELDEARRASAAAGGGARDTSQFSRGGVFGAWDASKKITQPKSIRGIMNPEEARDLAPGIALSEQEESGIKNIWKQGVLSRADGGLGSVFYHAPGASAAPREIARPGPEPEPIAGARAGPSPRPAQGLSRRQINAFLTKTARAGSRTTRGLKGQGGKQSAVWRLTQTNSVAATFNVATSPMEEQSMIGAPFDGVDIKLKTVADPSSTNLTGSTPQSGSTQNDPCAEAQVLDALTACAQQKSVYMGQISDLMNQLAPYAAPAQSGLSQVETACQNKCPCECDACQNILGAIKGRCDAIKDIIPKFDLACAGVPASCSAGILGQSQGPAIIGLVPVCPGFASYQTLKCQQNLFLWSHDTVVGGFMNAVKCGATIIPGTCGVFASMNYPNPP